MIPGVGPVLAPRIIQAPTGALEPCWISALKDKAGLSPGSNYILSLKNKMLTAFY